MKNIENIENIPEQNIFSTSDLPLASTLVTLKFFMIGLDVQIEGVKNRPIGYFKFEDTPELRKAEQKFSQSLLYVEPNAFTTNMRSLKSRVMNAIQSPHQRA